MIIVKDTRVRLAPDALISHSLCVLAGSRVKTLCGFKLLGVEQPSFEEGFPSCSRCLRALARPAHIRKPGLKMTLCGKQIKGAYRFAEGPEDEPICIDCLSVYIGEKFEC